MVYTSVLVSRLVWRFLGDLMELFLWNLLLATPLRCRWRVQYYINVGKPVA
jgi:hypothetical protein